MSNWYACHLYELSNTNSRELIIW
eukprot:COSAG01_NODE_51324_length_355_cov_2.015625_2_plen_23_part_01